MPLLTPSSIPNAPRITPLALPAAQPNTLPAGTNPAPQNIFNNASIGGNNHAVNSEAITGSMTGNSLGNQVGGARGVTGGGNQQLMNSLMSLGGANLLNSAGGPKKLDMDALRENPQSIALVARPRQQQQQKLIRSLMHTNTLPTHNSAVDAMNPNNTGGLGGLTATSALTRQQFLNTLPTHKSAVDAMNPNNSTANNASSAAVLNQRSTLGYSIVDGIDIAGGATGTHNLKLNINVENSGSTGMGVDTDLPRRAYLLANRMGISHQDALKVLLNFAIQKQNG
jgi:hypothetical protein